MGKSKQHKQPCRECPWRLTSAPGVLGSNLDAKNWIKVAHGDTAFELDTTVKCHLATHDQNQCAGIAIYRANACKRPRNPNALILPADRNTVFTFPGDFLKHHEKQ